MSSSINSLRRGLALPGPFAVLHPIAFASLCTGLFAAVTGADLGPFAPLVVSFGVYLMLFGVALELAVAMRLMLRWWARRASDQTAAGES